jgi:NADH-quinone oxidoreductase subunit A
MPDGYLPIFLFLVLSASFPIVTLLAARLIRPASLNQTKSEPYECGIEAEGDARGRFSVRFFVVAILFVLFDVETVFLYPWAVRYQVLGWFGVAEVSIFLLILIAGYAWAWKKGALDWH